MAKFYQHKQTTIIAVLCLIVVGITYTYTHLETPFASPKNTTVVENASVNLVASSSDDWKKQFYNSSAFSSTTNDIGSIYGKNNVATDTTTTLTDKLSGEIITKFFQLKQNNLDGNTQLMQDAVDQTISDAIKNAGTSTVYEMYQINVIQKNDNSSLHTYANNTGYILSTYLPKDDVPALANETLTSNNSSELTSLDPIISAYKKTINSLLVEQVPQIVSIYHLDLLNNISRLLNVAENLRKIQQDPAQSLITLNTYNSSQDSLKTAVLGIKGVLTTNNITFLNTEPGSLFMNTN